MNRIIYSFEELTPYRDYDMRVAGYAEINWERIPADPSSGILRDGITFDIEAIYIYSLVRGKKAMSVTPATELYTMIEKELFEIHDNTIDQEIWATIDAEC